jgi:hypothetical protein
MYFCSGKSMHFSSGVDNEFGKAKKKQRGRAYFMPNMACASSFSTIFTFDFSASPKSELA